MNHIKKKKNSNSKQKNKSFINKTDLCVFDQPFEITIYLINIKEKNHWLVAITKATAYCVTWFLYCITYVYISFIHIYILIDNELIIIKIIINKKLSMRNELDTHNFTIIIIIMKTKNRIQ